MDEVWDQLERMEAAKSQLFAQIGELYIKAEELEKQKSAVAKSIMGLRTQLEVIHAAYEPLKSSLTKSLNLKDGVYSVDFKNRRIVPHEQVSDSGNSKPGFDNRGFGTGANGGNANDCNSATE